MRVVQFFVFSISIGLSISDSRKRYSTDSRVKLVSDVIRFYERPTTVVARVCWSLSQKMALASELMLRNKAIQFTYSNAAMEKLASDDMFIIVDLDCNDTMIFLEHADTKKMFAKPYRWIFISENDNILDEFKSLSILIDSEVIIAYEIAKGDFLLNLIYKVDKKSQYIQEPFGTWSTATGFVTSENMKTAASMRRKNVKGKAITASVVITDEQTKNNIFQLSQLASDNLARSALHVVLPIYDFMNATVDLTFTNTYGYLINDSWNGMVGQIVKGEADLCGSLLLMNTKRMPFINYLAQPLPVSAAFVFRDPPLSLQSNLYRLPFKPTVWICIGALILVLLLVIYVTAKWEGLKKQETKDEKGILLKADFSEIAIFVAATLTQQGSEKEFKGSLGRVVLFITLLIFLFLYTSYSANIVVLLQSSSDQIRTLSDLISSKLELGVEDEPYNRYYFTSASDRVRKAIITKVSRTGNKPNFMSLEEGVKLILNTDSPFAFHMNLDMGYKFVEKYFKEHEKCGLREIDFLPRGAPWLCCSQGTPFKEIYKIGHLRNVEHGLALRVHRFVYTSKPACTAKGGHFGSVNMVDFRPVLLCLLYGMIASLLILVLEIMIHKRQQRKEVLKSNSVASSGTWVSHEVS